MRLLDERSSDVPSISTPVTPPVDERFSRPPIPRPPGVATYSFVCPRCDIILADGVAYEYCPSCNSTVDWVDLHKPIWCCATCDAMINARVASRPLCQRCQRGMTELRPLGRLPLPGYGTAPGADPGRWRRLFDNPVVLSVTSVLMLAPTLSLALDPRWRWLGIGLLLPVVVTPALVGGVFLGSVGAAWREIRSLARDRRTRIIHGIEHATAIMLARRGVDVRGGQTDDGYFKVWVHPPRQDGGSRKSLSDVETVRRACTRAVAALRQHRWSLAIHPRCGSTWMILFLLASLAAVVAAAVGLLGNMEPRTMLQMLGAMLVVMIAGTRPLGYLFQRWLTVDVDFERVIVHRIVRSVESTGLVCHCVHVDVQPRQG